MKMETPEQTILYLQADIQKLEGVVNKLKTTVEHNLENFGVNIKAMAEKVGHALLRKRPCEVCSGRGQILLPVPPVDPKASKDCTGGPPLVPSKPCTDCDTIGTVWK
jgi:hypothetical protein